MAVRSPTRLPFRRKRSTACWKAASASACRPAARSTSPRMSMVSACQVRKSVVAKKSTAPRAERSASTRRPEAASAAALAPSSRARGAPRSSAAIAARRSTLTGRPLATRADDDIRLQDRVSFAPRGEPVIAIGQDLFCASNSPASISTSPTTSLRTAASYRCPLSAAISRHRTCQRPRQIELSETGVHVRERMGHRHLDRPIVRCIGQDVVDSAGSTSATGVGPQKKSMLRSQTIDVSSQCAPALRACSRARTRAASLPAELPLHPRGLGAQSPATGRARGRHRDARRSHRIRRRPDAHPAAETSCPACFRHAPAVPVTDISTRA